MQFLQPPSPHLLGLEKILWRFPRALPLLFLHHCDKQRQDHLFSLSSNGFAPESCVPHPTWFFYRFAGCRLSKFLVLILLANSSYLKNCLVMISNLLKVKIKNYLMIISCLIFDYRFLISEL